MIYQLRYGKASIELNIPDDADLPGISEPPFTIEKKEFQKDLLRFMPEENEGYKNIGIVISDKTRLCGYPEYLPWLTEVLYHKGAKKENITFYVAYGTHPKQSEEESLNSYGDTYKSFRFVHHNCFDEDALMELGVTARGTPVKIRNDVLNSSLIITFGAISHHYFAGFGGGRKLLFPGLADRRAIYKNHSLFLDRNTRRLSEGCQPGHLDGNPIAEDLKAIDELMPPKISIHGILNSKGKVSELLIGDRYEDFELACKKHNSYYRSGSEKQYDLVIASSGGYPKDINFIQGHKSVHHAAAFVKDGGNL